MVGLLIGIRLLMGAFFATFALMHVFWIPWRATRTAAQKAATVNPRGG
jgi:hypothetical protein